jgi:hypothetical protein
MVIIIGFFKIFFSSVSEIKMKRCPRVLWDTFSLNESVSGRAAHQRLMCSDLINHTAD